MNFTGLNFSSDLVRETNRVYSSELLTFVSVFLLLFLGVGAVNGVLFIQYRKRTIKLLDVFLLVIYAEITSFASILSLILFLFEATSQYSDLVRSLSFPFLINCFCLIQAYSTRCKTNSVQWHQMCISLFGWHGSNGNYRSSFGLLDHL